MFSVRQSRSSSVSSSSSSGSGSGSSSDVERGTDLPRGERLRGTASRGSSNSSGSRDGRAKHERGGVLGGLGPRAPPSFASGLFSSKGSSDLAGLPVSSRLSISELDVHEHLTAGERALQRLRWRIKCIWIAVVLVAGIGIDGLLFRLSDNHSCQWYLLPGHTGFWSQLAVNCCVVTVITLRLLLFALVPVLDQVAFTRVVIFVDLLLVLFMEAITVFLEDFHLSNVWVRDLTTAAFMTLLMMYTIACFWASCAVSAADAQRRMWLGLGIYAFASMVRPVVWVADVALYEHRVSPSAGFLPPQSLLLYVALRPKLRKKAQGYMMQWVEGRAATRGAASLACLIGHVPPEEALQMARARFRSVLACEVSLEFLADTDPESVHSTIAHPCALGACDAFISHAWADDGQAKHAALQAWRAAFVQRRGREPSIWFDKCCVNQNDIDKDLQGLPIFVKGCCRLVVLCGPSYLSRLWCITEIFTHVHMGGTIEDIELVPLLRAGSECEDAAAIEEAFNLFDAQECECYHVRDKQRILGVMEAAFGSLDEFNSIVKDIIREVRVQLDEVAHDAARLSLVTRQ